MGEIKGMIKLIKETQQVTEKFSKREIVITTDELYPQDVMLQFSQDKCALLDGFKEMDHVKCDFNLRGKEWVSPQGETKYFVSLDGWKISKGENSTPGESKAPKVDAPAEGKDDLPF